MMLANSLNINGLNILGSINRTETYEFSMEGFNKALAKPEEIGANGFNKNYKADNLQIAVDISGMLVAWSLLGKVVLVEKAIPVLLLGLL